MNVTLTGNESGATAVDYDPFAAPALARVVASTEAQREVWLAAKLGDEASLAYNEAVALTLRGPLDRAALAAALQDLVDRHDALRATFGPDGETFCVAASLLLALPVVDLVAEDATSREAALDAYRARAVGVPFDLEAGPLLRAELVRVAADGHVLFLCAHHLVCDGWSWWVIVRELGQLYARHAGAPAGTLADAPAFADYALATRQDAARAAAQADEAWWVAHYSPLPAPLDLPLDAPRPATRAFASARVDVTLDHALMEDVRKFGARHGASLFATLLSAFAATLGRIAGTCEVVLGIPAAAQAAQGLGDLVGHGVHLLPLRCVVDPAQPFADVLKATSIELLDALDHARCTFGSLVRQLDLPREASRTPLVNVLFNIDQALDQESKAFPGLDLAFASVPRCCENFELSVNAVQENGALRLECQYNTGLFEAATVTRWLHLYEALLRAALVAPQAALGALPWVDAATQAELAALQPPPCAWPRNGLAHQLFEAQAARAPQREAVRAGAISLTYGELDARANRIAHALRARGARRGTLVGIALDRDADLVAGVLGVLKAGAGYVPLDPAYPAERLAFMAHDAGLAVLLTQARHRTALAGELPLVVLDEAASAVDAQSAAPLPIDEHAATADDTAYVIYTSGSTGQPKGVVIPHHAAAYFLHATQQAPGLRADDRLVAVTTLSFDIAFLELMLPLAVGASVVVATRDEVRDGAALRQLVETTSATFLQATPAGWRLLLDAGWQGRPDFVAVSGGEPLTRDLAEALLARCGTVWNAYGPTECTVWSTFWKVANPARGITIGRPLPGTTVWVLDAANQPCPPGISGELWIGGAGVADGYLRRPAWTAERFVADPFSTAPGARLYRTGDRGRWNAHGLLEHQGRADFQIKVRGYRIEPGEIEARLVAGPGVAQAVVVAREARPGDVRLVAYVAAQDGAAINEAAVRERLHGQLPDYMVPQHVVVLAALPRLPNGKLDRARLPAPAVATPSINARPADDTPRDDIEHELARMMADVLGHPCGRTEDFFAAGGHSLLAAQFIARVNRACDTRLTLRTMFEAPTVARLAEGIRRARQGGADAVAPIARRADRVFAPLTSMQQRVWYVEQMHPGSVAWNTPSAHRLRGDMDVAAFERALQAIVQRQSVLRTGIEMGADGVRQRVSPQLDVRLPLEDLSQLPAATREAQLQARLDALIEAPFDLAVAPLFRARLFRLAPQEHVFFFMAHHVIWDGWSFDLLYQEMAALYAAFAVGKPDPLPPLAVEYGDFAVWHRARFGGAARERQLAPWLARLANPPAPLALPADRPRPPRMSGQAATEWIRVGAAPLRAVHALADRLGTTAFVVLLAAFAALLQRLSGQSDFVVSTPVRNRDEIELERVMGFFVNALPLRLMPQAGESFAQLVAATRQAVLDAFASPDLPFEDLVRALHLPHDESRPPLAQAMFSFQDVRGRVTTWGGLQHEHLPVFQHGGAEDLGLWFVEQADGLLGGLSFNTDIFEPATAQRFHAGYTALLASALATPDAALADLPMAAVAATVTAPAAPAASTPEDARNESDVPRGMSVEETRLAAIWCALIGVAEARPEDNFFDLGGHSLLAIEMATRVQREFGVRLNLIDIATGTLATLAASLPTQPVARVGLGGRIRHWFGRP